MDIKDIIRDESKKGNIVILTEEGIKVGSVQEFIKQPASGILYDLNRLEEVTMMFIDDPKRINDYACAMVIRALKDRIEELEKQHKSE